VLRGAGHYLLEKIGSTSAILLSEGAITIGNLKRIIVSRGTIGWLSGLVQGHIMAQ
jgi:hypothetical protein